jgi:predicted DNA-binding antitoxin AbrB/MazE fold protein
MANIIEATFDGKVLRPDEPLELAPNTRVRIAIEEVLPDSHEAPSFLEVARSLRIEGPPDWSANLDKYLYGHFTNTLNEHEDEQDEQRIP